MATYLPFQKLKKSKMNKTCKALREMQEQTHKQFFYEPQHIDVLVLANQQKLTSALYEHWMQFRGPTRSN